MAAGELHTILEMAEAIPGRRFFHAQAPYCAGWADGIAGAGLYFLNSTALDTDHHILDPVPCRVPYLRGWSCTEPKPEPEPDTEDMPIEQFYRLQYQAQNAGAEAYARFEARRVCWLYPKDGGGFHELCADRAWRNADTGCVYSTPYPTLAGNWAGPTHVRMKKPK